MFEYVFGGIKRSIETFKRPSFQVSAFSYGEKIASSEVLTLPKSGQFKEFYWNKKGDSLLAVNMAETAFLKIGIKRNPKKVNSVKEESEIVRFLNQQGAVTCPQFIEEGELDGAILGKIVGSAHGLDTSVNYYFFSQEYIATSTKGYIADLILTLLEQKSLGIYHADVKPENIRVAEKTGICYLVDYDQAIRLSPEGKKYSNQEFLTWMDKKQKEMYGFDTWLRHFKGVDSSSIQKMFENGSFNLVNTTFYWNQRTTNTKNGVYHTITSPEVVAHGVRDLSDRKKILDQMPFKPGEKTLDIGCNVGLLSFYLSKRGASATGYELDPNIIWAAKILNNIWNEKVHFECFDLDSGTLDKKYDTVMLFSVFHHTKDLHANGAKIASNCDRIIIECRLKEQGRKPKLVGWEETSKWDYATLTDLYKGLEDYFPGFKFFQNHGSADKGRYILELRKSN